MRFIIFTLIFCITNALIAQQFDSCRVTGKINNLVQSGYGVIKLEDSTVISLEGSIFEIKLPPRVCHLLFEIEGYESLVYQLELDSSCNYDRLEVTLTKVKVLNEVVVTGNMRETFRSESTTAIDVIKSDLFKKNPTPNIFESLSMVNGIRPQMQCNVCNTGDIHINGMEGPYTMVMIDGMPIVSALGSVYGLMGIPNSIIDRIEVQKGPASTLYGSEAVGGLINIITRNPNKSSKFSIDFISNSYKESNLDMAVRYRISKRILVLSSGNFFWYDSPKDINHDNFTDIAIQKRTALFNKISIEHRSGKRSNHAVRIFTEDRWGGEMQWSERWRGSDSIYGESIYTKRIEVIGSIPLALLGNSKFQYSVVSHNQNSAYGNTLFKANQNLILTQLTKNLSFSRHDLLSGISLRYSHYDDNTIITKKTDGINNPEVVLLPGIFIQDDYSLFKKHKILAGIRYDYNSNHGHVFSPRFNWKYSINHMNTLRAGIGNGYRVVSLFSEDHAAYSGAREIKIASKLKPEQSWNINLNYSTFLNYKKHLLAIETNVFATYFSNKIVADYFTDPNKIIFDNLQGYGITRGIGASIEWSSNWPIKAMLGITFVDLYLMNPDSVGNLNRTEQVHTPHISMNYLVSYTINKRNISIDISGNTYSPMLLPTLPFDYRPSHSPWFSILNLQATKKWPKWEIYSGVKNLLNFIPKEDPIMRPMDPFDKNISDNVSNPYGYTFDPGYNYAPIQRTRVYFGIRYFLK